MLFFFSLFLDSSHGKLPIPNLAFEVLFELSLFTLERFFNLRNCGSGSARRNRRLHNISLRLHVIVGGDHFGIIFLLADLRTRHLNICRLQINRIVMNVQGVGLDKVAPLTLAAYRQGSANWLITFRLHVIADGHHKATIFLPFVLRARLLNFRKLPSHRMIAWRVALDSVAPLSIVVCRQGSTRNNWLIILCWRHGIIIKL